jgi:hypothetical protein
VVKAPSLSLRGLSNDSGNLGKDFTRPAYFFPPTLLAFRVRIR